MPAIKSLFLDLLFPVRCAQCGAVGAALCAPCAQKIRFIPPSCFVCKKLAPACGAIAAGRTCRPCRAKTRVHGFISPFSYDTAAIKTLVHDLKYRRARGNAEVLAELLYRAIAYHGVAFSRNALLVPIPLHPARERARGFNQSHLIAQALGEKIGIPARDNILRKIKKTKPQMECAREERLKNMAGVFVVSNSAEIKDKTIILLDDVKTTGATIEEAAKVLKAAGAKRVWAITLAH